jgi:hypothetical protein
MKNYFGSINPIKKNPVKNVYIYGIPVKVPATDTGNQNTAKCFFWNRRVTYNNQRCSLRNHHN